MVNGWQPAEVKAYGSDDPYQRENPELTAATTDWIENTVAVTQRLRAASKELGKDDATLAYLSGKRAAGGRRMTIATETIADADEGIKDWLTHLPDAERLRPVAHPWKDGTTVVYDKEADSFQEISSTPALQALTGGSGDGRAVREREAWERGILPEVIKSELLEDKTLKITSLGTGTGEPSMDTGLAVMNELYPDNTGKVQVTGFDVKPLSLKVATHMAEMKRQGLANPESLTFVPRIANLLSEEGIKEAVGGTGANVYEAIGFAEYVPSDHATDPAEIQMRRTMERAGMLSAEDFYGTIYENMPEGAVLITGNMRNDSPQGDFVIDGLGWPGIIRRGTEEYLEILRKAGIPGESVQLFVPDPDKSAAVYNLVAITKPISQKTV